MFEQLDPRSPTPLYEQIAARIRVAIAAEELTPGAAIPSVRSLSSRLRVNPATVVQAYRDLEREGFVTTRHGSGTYVNEVPTHLKEDERAAQAARLVHAMIAEAGRLGVSVDELAQQFEREVARRV